MWKIVIASLFVFSIHAVDMSKSDQEKIMGECLTIHTVKSTRKKVCKCVVDNLTKLVKTAPEIAFLVKYYKKKTKMECGDFAMLCGMDFNIAASCQNDHGYDVTDPKAKHLHHH